jgi:hypothetical protein
MVEGITRSALLRSLVVAVGAALVVQVSCDPDVEFEEGTTGSSAASASISSSGATTSSGSGGGAEPACTLGTDCTLLDDCCSCKALAPGEDAPDCDLETCLQPKCEELRFTDLVASCSMGRCTLFDCDTSMVSCRQAEPVCPAGQTASVQGICYGPCVPSTECHSVTSCSDCNPATQICVTAVALGGPTFHCVSRPSECDDKADCDCIGSSVCHPPFDECDEDDGVISCGCPTCS